MAGSCTKIHSDNFVDSEILANNDVSSEQAAFPVTNAFNKERRSRVWRSEGFYQIVSGSNTIVFRETIGVDLTATVVVDDYNSFTTFATAVKTAMEAAGGSVYTITQDSLTFKIRIASDGAGGGGILQLQWTDGSSTAMAGIMGYDTATNDTGSLSYTADVLRLATEEFILFDMGMSSNPTFFAMIGKRNSAIALSPTATFKLQGNETNDFTTPTFEQTLTYDDEVILFENVDGIDPGGGTRYWRILFEDQSNPNGFIEIGAFFLGNSFDPSRGRAQFPFESVLVDRSTTQLSEGGQSFSDIRDKTQDYTLSWNALTKGEVEEIEQIFENFGTSEGLFVTFDTNAVFSPSQNNRTKFVKFSENPSYELISPNNFTASMRFTEEL